MRKWLTARELRRHRRWLKRSKVTLPAPHPGTVVRSRWQVPR
jgi:hypothetical protein